MDKVFYHTQECRHTTLNSPILCERDDAWLGEGYYFWKELDDAYYWGHRSKRATGKFQVYSSNINCENVLDTVFNEEHYYFWLEKITKAAKKILKSTNQKATIKELNDYLIERAAWNDVAGIQYQDLPENPDSSLVVIEYKSKTTKFIYYKRIQLVVFHNDVINSFDLIDTQSCV